jgi:hypothetical protein
VAVSDSFFTIEASVALLAMSASPAPTGQTGVVVSWSTDPGPEDLSGYRLERRAGAVWTELVSLTKETSYLDAEAPAGALYRLFAVNGMGHELLLGEVRVGAGTELSAWPTPFSGGEMKIAYATAGGLGGSPAPAALSLHDAAGRLVRRIDSGVYGAGTRTVTWDGLDSEGRRVSAGVYFLRSESAGHKRSLKVMVVN